MKSKILKLKLTADLDDKPVKITVELPAAVHGDLVAYAEILARQCGKAIQNRVSETRPSYISSFGKPHSAAASNGREGVSARRLICRGWPMSTG